ncbi:hypothetical protein [Specibacter cremeus]|uniref:hypothetical protein n=1 Tax=Specibacter cremeus TaxID=1629051 RepID=UPI000F7B3284|nr:hypothetical protein [Specibacter cremeus]
MTAVEGNLSLVLGRRPLWQALFVIAGLTAALCWSVIVVLALASGGPAAIMVLLGLTVATSVWTVTWLRRDARRHALSGARPKHEKKSPGWLGRMIATAVGLTGILIWFGVYAMLDGDGTFVVLTGLPLASTTVACIAYRRWKSAMLHRAT